jgi:NitT/TauT family transport system substrate-binding protein
MPCGATSQKEGEEVHPGVIDILYTEWRQYDPEDTVRFYALRLREAGMIKGNPQTIPTQGADWRFVNELKKELKG